MDYAKPDRSDFVPTLEKEDMDDALDLGWGEGKLSDGRSFRIECWAQHGATVLTWFFSVHGLEECQDADLLRLLMAEGLLESVEGQDPAVQSKRITDASNNDLWSFDVVIGDDEGVRMRDRHPLQRYDV